MNKYMNNLLIKYEGLRGSSNPGAGQFWDVVVITTTDKDQQMAYEIQIQAKLDRKELPTFCDYCVISDPIGPKCGNGGATFVSLEFLHNKYGDKLYNMKILILHSGGQSQRLPSASILGKAFTLLPFGRPLFQQIDLQFATYLPFVERMKSGVLITSSDIILTFDLDGFEDNIKFSDITALAHLSEVPIGCGHGVYVVDEEVDTNVKIQELMCKRVLQKPTINQIIESGAILQIKNEPTNIDQLIYTDSSFFFSHNITRKFLQFYQDIKPLTCEVDAYGDFLQALGYASNDDYIQNTVNIASVSKELLEIRKCLYNILKNTDFKILALNVSSFNHIGTSDEYRHHFCTDNLLHQMLPFQLNYFARMGEIHYLNSCVLHSILHSNSTVGEKTIVEFCHFEMPIKLGDNSILSNCSVTHCADNSELQTPLQVPSNMFIHTVPVKNDGNTGFVTMYFDTHEDLKGKPKSIVEQNSLPFAGVTLQQFLDISNLSLQAIMPCSDTPANLWLCKLFPVCTTMCQSFLLTLQLISALKQAKRRVLNMSDYVLMSPADILANKSITDMLAFRESLYKSIKFSAM